MTYENISNSEIASGRALTKTLVRKLRDNARVGKAPQGAVFTASGSWVAPAHVEQAKATIIGGGGTGFSLQEQFNINIPGGIGGAGIVWTPVTPGGTYAIVVGAAGEASSFGGFATATGGEDADQTANAADGTFTVTAGASRVWRRTQNSLYMTEAGRVYGQAGDPNFFQPPGPGLVIVEF